MSDFIEPQKIASQATMFANRLEKQYKHLRKWARRTNTSCYRLYDKDIPEIPLAVDLYQEYQTDILYLHISLYERPYEKSAEEEDRWMQCMKKAASEIMNIPEEKIYTKVRKKQRGEESQYEKIDIQSAKIIIQEGGSQFLVNLSEYLDTGIFLDHRSTRLMVREESKEKKVLNLFCYTGAFSVHAACAGATSVTSVDLSKTYLAWAAENLALNGFRAFSETISNRPPRYNCVHADVKAFLAKAKREGEKWDIIICDPPTFSNSKRAVDILDINKDWAELCRNCLSVLNDGGTLYFSTNSRSLKFDSDSIGGAASREGTLILDLSEKSIPEDFRNKKIHRLWKIVLPSVAST